MSVGLLPYVIKGGRLCCYCKFVLHFYPFPSAVGGGIYGFGAQFIIIYFHMMDSIRTVYGLVSKKCIYAYVMSDQKFS